MPHSVLVCAGLDVPPGECFHPLSCHLITIIDAVTGGSGPASGASSSGANKVTFGVEVEEDSEDDLEVVDL